MTCGGTGGHITPAIAIADLLKANLKCCDILFVGNEGGMEQALVPAAGYPIKTLSLRGLSRQNPVAVFETVKKTRRAIKEAGELLDAFGPDIVIGTGGYVCYPALSAAISRGIPSAVHESNAIPGLAVRLLAPRLSRVWLGFEAARSHLSKRARCLVIGNPLPKGFLGSSEKRCDGKRRVVLSFGGSLGASVLNTAVLDLMEQTKGLESVYHVHATGKREFERFLSEMEVRGLTGDKRLEILPFITDMPRRLALATVVVCRAGAMSIGEIAMAGRAAVLVPSPNVTGDHQTKNASALAKKGAALLLRENEIGEKLLPSVRTLLEDRPYREGMERAVREFAHPNANKEIYHDILGLVGRK